MRIILYEHLKQGYSLSLYARSIDLKKIQTCKTDILFSKIMSFETIEKKINKVYSDLNYIPYYLRHDKASLFRYNDVKHILHTMINNTIYAENKIRLKFIGKEDAFVAL